ncbi:hypothetical protein OW763_01440 [Clostridium aestuarii]|uniref:Uncharacterized protein n=1 Tax=Clostridium aestuarii TaxID=338193 RepID=A0ABT4CVL8_9CLOT|nr:hypothetical protein [Clostridium aestuarii]MCY6483016.1 hypothetical protein [Clostridium aestuarii]
MHNFKLNDLKEIHVGNLPAAKMGIIDSLSGEDSHKPQITPEHIASYRQGHELGSEIENLLKGDQSTRSYKVED